MEPINIQLRSDLPLSGCKCSICEAARVKAERPRTYSLGPADYNPFGQSIKDLAENLSSLPTFTPEQPAEPEPAYTHVLLDYDEAGQPHSALVELHTAESLLEAIAYRYDDGGHYKVFELGPAILHVTGE